MSDNATKVIAGAVQSMVSKVLDKSYIADSCMAMLTSDEIHKQLGSAAVTDEAKRQINRVQELCAKLVSKGIAKALISTNYEPDEYTKTLETAISTNPGLRDDLNKWLKMKGLEIVATDLIYGGHSDLRRQAIEDLITKAKDKGDKK